MENTQQYLMDNLVYPLWNDKSMDVIRVFFDKAVDVRTTFVSGTGLDIFKQSVSGTFEVFPNLNIRVEDVMQAGNKYVYKWTGQGTQTGSIMGMEATGYDLQFSGVVFGEITNGFITTYHSFSNIPHVLRNVYFQKNILASSCDSPSLLELYQAIKKLVRFPLTRREIECLTAWLRGCTIKETAKRMGGLSERTIQTYRENIKKKFGAHNYQQVLHVIQYNGLLPQFL